MKDLSADMLVSIRRTLFHHAMCWRTERLDGFVLTFTAHDKVLPIADEGSPDTVRDYQPDNAFAATAFSAKSNMSVDNLEAFSLTSDDITERDLLAGKWDQAMIEFFVVDWNDLGAGKIPHMKGFIGEVRLGDLGFAAELRDLAQRIQQQIVKTFSLECRADLFDDQCRVQQTPPRWATNLNVVARMAKDGRAAESGSPEVDTNTVRPTLVAGTVKSTGFTAFGTVEHVAGAGPDWTNPTNVQTDDTNSAASVIPFLSTSDKLRCTNAGLSIPAGSVITGYEFRYRRLESAGAINDGVANLYANGVVGDDLFGLAAWTGVAALSSFGGAADLMGASLTIADIEASTFGFQFDAVSFATGTAQVEFAEINVHYAVLDADQNQFYFEAQNAGVTGAVEPTWNAVLDGETADNGITWKAIHARQLVGTVTQWHDRRHFEASAFQQPLEYWKYGMVTWLTGANTDLKMEVREFEAGHFSLWESMAETLAIGDTFTLQSGCAKRFDEDCVSKYANGLNFDGENNIPGSDEVNRYPDRK